MWLASLLVFHFLQVIAAKLTGPHICQEEIRYRLNVTEYVLRNSTVRNYKWCLNVPPRCSFYTTRLLNESIIVEKEMVKNATKCCPNFEEDIEKKTCQPKCPKCANGICTLGICNCSTGWTGNVCDLPCPTNKFGENCTEQCNCSELQSCDVTLGCVTSQTTSNLSIPIVSNGKFRLISTTEVENIVAVHQIEEAASTSSAHPPENHLNRKDLVSGAGTATAISLAVIVSAVLIVIANHWKRKEKLRKNCGKATVSVYAHSIFHTPLPEPPLSDTATLAEKSSERFETHVVCSMNFPNKEFLYDHPPSTGSYRAAPLPEPPPNLEIIEPLYDEIPSGLAPTPITQPPPSYKSSTLYMNTCAKTRL